MEGLKELIRPPFANCDVVVYFGGGLFCIPFVNRYLMEPMNLEWPKFSIHVGSPFADEIVSGLSLVFFVYIVGHILAYVSSQIIEKMTDRILGKISTSIIVSAWSSPKSRNELVRSVIYDKIKKIRQDKAIIPTVVRGIAHAPAIPVYIAIYALGVFSYYETRVPYSVIRLVRDKIEEIGVPNLKFGIREKWFKPLEYFVINRFPSAVVRMYNYLVIGGLFRTLCLIFLISMWFQLYYALHFQEDGDWFLRPFMGSSRKISILWEYICSSFLYLFCFCSYLKFQRRYAEEAIFAFAFGIRSEASKED